MQSHEDMWSLGEMGVPTPNNNHTEHQNITRNATTNSTKSLFLPGLKKFN